MNLPPLLSNHIDVNAATLESYEYLTDLRGLIIAFFKYYNRIQIQSIRLIEPK